ncbi:hypothetical protein BDZ89DRAFT_1079933 [Hymenopellis radicata]|nr:hypothetical protein BDZ89DRAFT_1079933 [Hymenopellis radicata]
MLRPRNTSRFPTRPPPHFQPRAISDILVVIFTPHCCLGSGTPLDKTGTASTHALQSKCLIFHPALRFTPETNGPRRRQRCLLEFWAADVHDFPASSNGVIDYSSNTVPAVPAILPTPYWPGNVSSYGGSESARLSTLASTLPTATSNELTQLSAILIAICDLGADVPLRRSTLSLHGRNQAAVERRRIHPAILSCSRSHILVSHFRMRLPCPINECEKEFHHENALRRHLRAQHYSAIAHFMGRLLPSDTTTASQDPASAICLGCHVRVVFQTKPDLENHIMRKHLDTRFPCPFVGCGDWYSEVPSLRQHMRETHDDVMNLKCYTVRQPERVLDG